jgi:hypothetical protein
MKGFLAVKIFISAILAISLLGVVGTSTASSAREMHPHSFDYYDENGVEHTGINLNLGGVSRHDPSERTEHSADARHHWSRDHHETVLLLLLEPDRD